MSKLIHEISHNNRQLLFEALEDLHNKIINDDSRGVLELKETIDLIDIVSKE